MSKKARRLLDAGLKAKVALEALRNGDPACADGRFRRSPAATLAIDECGRLPHTGDCPELVGRFGRKKSGHSF